MTELSREIATFEALQAALEAEHSGKWALIHDGSLVGTFESFDSAATDAVKRFGRGPYLIRQIGASVIILPASVMYTFVNARD
jgi:hypothetical protein